MTSFVKTLLTGVLTLSCVTAIGQQPSSIGSTMPAQGVLMGVLEPWRKSEVACVETGLIQSIFVKKGDRVKGGDRLAELRTETTKIQLELAEAQATASGRITTARAEVSLNERKVAAFQAARANASSSQLELERAQADLEIARGRLQAELDERKVLELRAGQMRQALLERVVIAPIDGIIAEVHKELGELVAPNTPEIFKIVDISKLRAKFFLTAQEVRTLPADRKVQVELSGGERLQAEVENIVPVADKDSGLIIVSILIDNAKFDILSSSCTLVLKMLVADPLVKSK
jgi:RND family efflux transporter MFP subunit